MFPEIDEGLADQYVAAMLDVRYLKMFLSRPHQPRPLALKEVVVPQQLGPSSIRHIVRFDRKKNKLVEIDNIKPGGIDPLNGSTKRLVDIVRMHDLVGRNVQYPISVNSIGGCLSGLHQIFPVHVSSIGMRPITNEMFRKIGLLKKLYCFIGGPIVDDHVVNAVFNNTNPLSVYFTGDLQITCKMIQGGKRRVVCHGPGDCGADGLYGR